ncbi:Toll-like receptor 7 [Pseudolycoriella hygida]|uniref:Toll-like receptor 7 n=1 Tax=Pseudolycoriella hygida TaxID=35572 RepID=A0A9Q0S8L4_9DIPT|nr:Toll-like receptor 7 [Pseudolycoriella hygida]
MCRLLLQITIVLALGYAWLMPFSCATSIVKVRCDEDVEFFCMVTQKLDIKERVHFDFVSADKWNNTKVFKIISQNHITSIPTGIFQRFPHLIKVYVRTGLNSIRKEDFEGADNVLRLDLEYNNIESIAADLFSDLKRLEDIYLSYNQLKNIESNAFYGLDNLHRIELSNNSLTAITTNMFCGLNNLMELILNNNRIELIEDEALNLPKLKKLILTNNRIHSLSDSTFSHSPQLQWIDVNENGLRNIAKSLYDLRKLERLQLEDNKIDDIEMDSLGRLPSLTSLKLRNSGFKVTNLNTELHVKYNSVIHLDLAKNWIEVTDILQRLKNFVNLEVLLLDENNLTDIDGIEKVWSIFPKIQHVAITRNKLTCDRVEEIYESHKNNSKFLIEVFMPRLPQILLHENKNEKKVHGVVCL